MTVRTFLADDQMAFAALSGDYNPIHVDEVAARRLMFGRPVVHGIHLVLWALDGWCQSLSQTVELGAIRADFLKPIGVGEPVHYTLKGDVEHGVIILLSVGNTVRTKITFNCIPSTDRQLDRRISPKFPERERCRTWSETALKDAVGKLDLCIHEDATLRLFPTLRRFLPAIQVAGLLASTRLVGVHCPGRDSIYSQVALKFSQPEISESEESTLDYSVAAIDSRFNLVILNIAAPGMAGTVRAFVRPQPRDQISFAEVRHAIQRDEFKDQRALVVGGSRGLGEVTAKALAAGGADVRVTYYRGAEDARRVVAEIRAGGGTAECQALDVLNPQSAWQGPAGDDWAPTHLYYFATPFIAPGERGAFSAERFATLSEYYVAGFARLFERLARLGLRQVFYPSSVYAETPPDNFGEYAVAKMAGETLCLYLEKTHRGITIHRPRLPRMATDQTASVMPAENYDPLPIVLDQLRQLHAAGCKATP